MPTVLGRAVVTVGGKRYNTKPGATLDPGGISREPVVGDTGVAGPQASNNAPSIECTIIKTDEVTLKEIQDITDATITFDGDDGSSYIITNGFNGPVPKLSRDGISATFYGISCEEV